jgi:chromate transporter
VFGVLPFWDAIRRRVAVQAALKGVNAAVVGLLLAALYNPVWTAGILNGWDFALATGAFLLLFIWKTPPWLVVFLCGIGGAARISLMG